MNIYEKIIKCNFFGVILQNNFEMVNEMTHPSTLPVFLYLKCCSIFWLLLLVQKSS